MMLQFFVGWIMGGLTGVVLGMVFNLQSYNKGYDDALDNKEEE